MGRTRRCARTTSSRGGPRARPRRVPPQVGSRIGGRGGPPVRRPVGAGLVPALVESRRKSVRGWGGHGGAPVRRPDVHCRRRGGPCARPGRVPPLNLMISDNCAHVRDPYSATPTNRVQVGASPKKPRNSGTKDLTRAAVQKQQFKQCAPHQSPKNEPPSRGFPMSGWEMRNWSRRSRMET